METKFVVKKAVIALAENDDRDSLFWNLSRLLTWAFLDQKKGSEKRNARNARHVAFFILHAEMHDRWSEIQAGTRAKDVEDLLRKYSAFGGPRRATSTPTPKSLFRQFRKSEKHTRFIFRIVDYLCRAKVSALASEHLTVNFAKAFVERTQVEFSMKPYKESRISKDWEKYASAAALIYSAYVFFPDLVELNDWRQVCLRLRSVANNTDDVRRFIGYAAYAAKTLSDMKVRKPFTGSFSHAASVTPPPRPFSADEQNTISQIDLNGPIL